MTKTWIGFGCAILAIPIVIVILIIAVVAYWEIDPRTEPRGHLRNDLYMIGIYYHPGTAAAVPRKKITCVDFRNDNEERTVAFFTPTEDCRIVSLRFRDSSHLIIEITNRNWSTYRRELDLSSDQRLEQSSESGLLEVVGEDE